MIKIITGHEMKTRKLDIDEEAYNKLRAVKRSDETYSDLITRLFRGEHISKNKKVMKIKDLRGAYLKEGELGLSKPDYFDDEDVITYKGNIFENPELIN